MIIIHYWILEVSGITGETIFCLVFRVRKNKQKLGNIRKKIQERKPGFSIGELSDNEQ